MKNNTIRLITVISILLLTLVLVCSCENNNTSTSENKEVKVVENVKTVQPEKSDADEITEDKKSEENNQEDEASVEEQSFQSMDDSSFKEEKKQAEKKSTSKEKEKKKKEEKKPKPVYKTVTHPEEGHTEVHYFCKCGKEVGSVDGWKKHRADFIESNGGVCNGEHVNYSMEEKYVVDREAWTEQVLVSE